MGEWTHRATVSVGDVVKGDLLKYSHKKRDSFAGKMLYWFWVGEGEDDLLFLKDGDFEPLETPTKDAAHFLNAAVAIQKDRSKEYGKVAERSFEQVAEAYNAIKGVAGDVGEMQGSDVALLLQILKDVRQYQNPESFHYDSALDKVSYASLHAEELLREKGGEV